MRALIVILAIISLFTLLPPAVNAGGTPEFRLLVGAYVPTAKQADLLESSLLVGGQAAYELTENVHLVGTLSFATPQHDTPTGARDVNIYQYDAGAELFQIVDLSEEWTLRPFLGMGLGGRTYDVRHEDWDSQTNFLGYGALGTEFQKGRVAARIEGRDYVSHFDGLNGEAPASTRNDLVFSGGVSVHF